MLPTADIPLAAMLICYTRVDVYDFLNTFFNIGRQQVHSSEMFWAFVARGEYFRGATVCLQFYMLVASALCKR